MKKIIFILLISLFFFSCKKKQTIHITAKNAATGEPYPGLTYYVVTYKNVLKPYGGTKSKTVATGTLDENGEAYVTERLSKNNGHGVRVVEPENSCYNKNIQLYFSDETNFKAEFEFAECAYLKFQYKNISCQNSDDHIRVKRFTNLDGYSGFLIDAEYSGCTDYTMPNYVEVPMGEWFFEWQVTKNNITSNFYDTIFLSKGEQKIYEINY